MSSLHNSTNLKSQHNTALCKRTLAVHAQHDAALWKEKQLSCSAALQQEKHQVELQAHSAKVDDVEVRQLTAKIQQLEADNSELQSQLAKEVRIQYPIAICLSSTT